MAIDASERLARLEALKSAMGRSERALAEGIEARGDPCEMADMVVLLTLAMAIKRGSVLAPGQVLDLLRECLTLASMTTAHKTLATVLEERTSEELLRGHMRACMGEMRTSVSRVALFGDLLREPPNARK